MRALKLATDTSSSRVGFHVPRVGTVRKLDISRHARKKEVDREIPFSYLYESTRDKILAGKSLPARDTYEMIENVRSPEQVIRCLELIQRHLDNRAKLFLEADPGVEPPLPTSPRPQMPGAPPGTPAPRTPLFSSAPEQDPPPAPAPPANPAARSNELNEQLNVRLLSDWHFRKRHLMRLCELSLFKMKRPELVFRIMGGMRALRIGRSFGADLLKKLAEQGADMEVMMVVAFFVTRQLGPESKASKDCWKTLLTVTRSRKGEKERQQHVLAMMNAKNDAPLPQIPLPLLTALQQRQQQLMQQRQAMMQQQGGGPAAAAAGRSPSPSPRPSFPGA